MSGSSEVNTKIKVASGKMWSGGYNEIVPVFSRWKRNSWWMKESAWWSQFTKEKKTLWARKI